MIVSPTATHARQPASRSCGGHFDVPYPLEQRLIGTAGTVVVFNSHTWHSAGYNASTGDRPALTMFKPWARPDRCSSHQ